MKKILITGGSGFIGTNLIDKLAKDKELSIINFDKIAPVKPSHFQYWTKGDIMDVQGMSVVFRRHLPDVVIHLAARTDTLSDQLDDYLENHIGTLNILSVIKDSHFVERVIITSTQYVYKSEIKPFPEFDDEFLPHTVYGQSKVLTEEYTREANLNCIWTIIRPTNIWGPWHMRYPNELWKVIDNGMYYHPVNHEVKRTYGYVKNIVHQIHGMLTSPSQIVNKKMFYVGDPSIDSYDWLNELSIQLTNNKLKRVPTYIFSGIAKIGDFLRSFGVPFPLYSKRFQNMVEDYPAPTEITVKIFGQSESNLKQNVKETVNWLRGEGKVYFPYWNKK